MIAKRACLITAPFNDPAPNCRWIISTRDTFDRESPVQPEIEGFGVIPGLMELWARFLFETVTFASRHHGNGVYTEEAKRGFTDFWIRFDEGRAESIDGDFACAGRIRPWVFGDIRGTIRTVIEEANVDVIRIIAWAHSRIRHAPESAANVLACACDTDRDAFFTRLRKLGT